MSKEILMDYDGVINVKQTVVMIIVKYTKKIQFEENKIKSSSSEQINYTNVEQVST